MSIPILSSKKKRCNLIHADLSHNRQSMSTVNSLASETSLRRRFANLPCHMPANRYYARSCGKFSRLSAALVRIRHWFSAYIQQFLRAPPHGQSGSESYLLQIVVSRRFLFAVHDRTTFLHSKWQCWATVSQSPVAREILMTASL